MAEIVLNISGVGGLVDYNATDDDLLSPRPELRQAGEGQMVSGYFNPYLRRGYLSPATTTVDTVTLDSTPSAHLSSVAFSPDDGYVYAAARGQHVYSGNGISDTTLTEIIDLGSGKTITDLEVYEKNAEKTLFYTYLADKHISSYRNTAPAALKNWIASGIAISPSGSETPRVVAKEEKTLGGGSRTFNIEVPSSASDVRLVMFLLSYGSTAPTTVAVDSVAMTELHSRTVPSVNPERMATYHAAASAGTRSIEVETTAGCTLFVYAVSGVSATPFLDSSILQGATQDINIELDYGDSVLHLTAASAFPSKLGPARIGAAYNYDAAAQADNAWFSSYLSDDGLKLFVLGESGTFIVPAVYEYDLSTAWRINTATYSGNSVGVSAHINTTDAHLVFSSNGEELYICRDFNPNIIRYTLGTAWDLSTATHTANHNLPDQDYIENYRGGLAISEDGTKIYRGADILALTTTSGIVEYTLSTPWDISSASSPKFTEVPYSINFSSMGLLMNDTSIYYSDREGAFVYMHPFDPNKPLDVDGIDFSLLGYNVASLSGLSVGGESVFIRKDGGLIVGKDYIGSVLGSNFIDTSSFPNISSESGTLSRAQTSERVFTARQSSGERAMDIGVVAVPSIFNQEDNWLSKTQGRELSVGKYYPFLRKADNGFTYLFVRNAVHKIDGGVTGGVDGSFTKNVLLFPDFFSLTDALDYRSNMYIAVSQHRANSESPALGNFRGRCGVFVWNRISTQFSNSDYIEIPGVREIKRLYASPDGVLKMIVINDDGLTELRMFGYNDSGGVVFPVARSLGLGAHPQYQDGLSVAGNKTVWLANNGNFYAESNNNVVKLWSAKPPGSTEVGVVDNITSGIVLFGSEEETAGAGSRVYKQGITVSYNDGTIKHRRLYPFDLTTGDNSDQTPNAGNVYTGVTYIPVTSRVKRVRIYNAPVSSTGSTVIATVKLYFNQSTDATMPNGMTKSITLDEAKRGYVDFNINKPYVHAVQLEIEWATGTPIGDDMYMPSVALISTEDTTVATPDTE